MKTARWRRKRRRRRRRITKEEHNATVLATLLLNVYLIETKGQQIGRLLPIHPSL